MVPLGHAVYCKGSGSQGRFPPNWAWGRQTVHPGQFVRHETDVNRDVTVPGIGATPQRPCRGRSPLPGRRGWRRTVPGSSATAPAAVAGKHGAPAATSSRVAAAARPQTLNWLWYRSWDCLAAYGRRCFDWHCNAGRDRRAIARPHDPWACRSVTTSAARRGCWPGDWRRCTPIAR